MMEIAAYLALAVLVGLTVLLVWFGRRHFLIGAPLQGMPDIVATLAEIRKEVARTNGLLEELIELERQNGDTVRRKSGEGE